MTQSTSNPVPARPSAEKLATIDYKSLEKTESSYEGIPSLNLNESEENQLARLGTLRRKLDERKSLLPEEEREKKELEGWIGNRVERYRTESELELRQSPKEAAFEGFESIREELEEIEGKKPEKIRPFSIIAVEEARILVHRLFGKNHVLRSFFEQYMVLKYDAERSTRRAEEAHSPEPTGMGGATVNPKMVGGQRKFVVTVDEATFMQRKIWYDVRGNEHSYLEPNYVNAAYTIGKAVLVAALNDKTLQEFEGKFKDHQAPLPERFVEESAPHRVDARAPEIPTQRALDFLAFYLLDPSQATKVDPAQVAEAKRILDGISPSNARGFGNVDGASEQPETERFTVNQSSLNYEYLYRDYDPDKRAKNALGSLLEKGYNTKPGVLARLGLGGIFGGIAANTLAGPASWLGIGAGAVAGAGVAGMLGAPLKFVRTIQAVYRERKDFYYEQAVSETDNKEVARIMAREEGIGDRDKRLQTLIDSGDEDGMRRMLICISNTGDFNIWRLWLYAFHFDDKFKRTNGDEITQKTFNLFTRLHRHSNKAHRVGTKVGFYERTTDKYGNLAFKLKDYKSYEDGVWSEWEDRSEREAQNTAPETFAMMNDGFGLMPPDAEYGEDLDDPNSRGWNVGETGDSRTFLGQDNARQIWSFMQHDFKGDRRYLRKFNANEITCIQRMGLFKESKYPGEHTKESAKEAFAFYREKIPAALSKVEEEDLAAQAEIEKRSVKELVEDDDVNPRDLIVAARQLDKETYDAPFAGSDKYASFAHSTIRGVLADELKHAKSDLGQIKSLDGELRYELGSLVRYVEDKLSGSKKDEKEAAEELRHTTEHIDQILADNSVSEDQKFTVKTWIAKVNHISPQVHLLDKFRTDLKGTINPYEKTFKAAIEPAYIEESKFVLEQLGSVTKAAKNKKDTSTPDELKERARKLFGQFRTLSSGKIDQEQLKLIQAIETAGSKEQIGTCMEELVKELSTWQEEQQKAIPTAEKEKLIIERLLEETKQALDLGKAGIAYDDRTHEREVREQRVAEFEKLSSVPTEEKVPSISDHEMYAALKVAYLVVSRRANEEKKEREKREKKDKGEKPKEDDGD